MGCGDGDGDARIADFEIPDPMNDGNVAHVDLRFHRVTNRVQLSFGHLLVGLVA